MNKKLNFKFVLIINEKNSVKNIFMFIVTNFFNTFLNKKIKFIYGCILRQ